MKILNGIIIINKEKDYTSNDVVQIVKKIFKEKVGHTGTLDPMATGVLPILIGKGTALSKYLINHDKIYVATVKLGIKTNTGDITGNITEETRVSEECLSEKNILNVLESIKGKQEQVPPMYSAIKVNGKKLYEYARKGEKVEVSGREIEIYNARVLDVDVKEKVLKFEIYCSKGTYIRTLCHDIGAALGCGGCMSALRRVRSGRCKRSPPQARVRTCWCLSGCRWQSGPGSIPSPPPSMTVKSSRWFPAPMRKMPGSPFRSPASAWRWNWMATAWSRCRTKFSFRTRPSPSCRLRWKSARG